VPADKRVPGRSDEEVRRIAERTKDDYGASKRRPVNILRHIESGSVLTIYGRKKLTFVVVDDEELQGVDAKTEFENGVVIITCKRSVRDRAEMGSGRDRMTLAHELGHAVLHHSVPLFRFAGAVGATDLAQDAAYKSAEHQAKVFAAAFLIHDEDAAEMSSAEEISVEFGVSKQAAEICFERLQKKAQKARSAERVMKMAEEAKAVLLGKKAPTVPAPQIVAPATRYLPAPCTVCGNETLISLGPTKVHCDTCGFNGDQLQDGDKLN
jgi:Zn-dependent peptidase ImmA (M78 family)/ribosomal protein S27E